MGFEGGEGFGIITGCSFTRTSGVGTRGGTKKMGGVRGGSVEVGHHQNK